MFGLQFAGRLCARLIYFLQELNPAMSGSTRHWRPKEQQVCSRCGGLRNQTNLLPVGSLAASAKFCISSCGQRFINKTRLIDLNQLEIIPIVGAHPSSVQHPESPSMNEATCKFRHVIFPSASSPELGRSTRSLTATLP